MGQITGIGTEVRRGHERIGRAAKNFRGAGVQLKHERPALTAVRLMKLRESLSWLYRNGTELGKGSYLDLMLAVDECLKARGE